MKDIDYLAKRFPKSVLLIGIDLKDSINKVADGAADTKIDELLGILTAYNRPILLRLAYGFDNPVNQYEPVVYVSVWKKFHERIQANGSLNVALVWDSASLCGDPIDGYSLSDWYPGDEFVDWIGLHYSNQYIVCEGQSIEAGIQFAQAHLKPVIITEAAPQGYEISDTDKVWNEWFVPFFKFVNNHNDVIRAITYINEGANNIQSNKEIIDRWKKETKQAFWLRGGPDLFDELAE
jgi:beta-mannanase